MKANAQRGVSTKRRLAVAFVLISAAVVWRGGALPVTAGARGEEVAGLTADVPVDASRDAATLRPAPVNVERLPGARNRPRRQPPRLLSAAEVEAGLAMRFRKMEERRRVREQKLIDPGNSQAAARSAVTRPDDDPPRAPEPPPPVESLSE